MDDCVLCDRYDTAGHSDHCCASTAKMVIQHALDREGILPRTLMVEVASKGGPLYQLRFEMLIDGEMQWVNVQDDDRQRRYMLSSCNTSVIQTVTDTLPL